MKLSIIIPVFNEEKIEVVNLSVQNKILTARTKAIDDKQELQLRTLIEKKFNTNVSVQRSETVGPVIGKESVNKTIIASVLAIIGILLYMSFAFKSFNFALAAIIALLHDFLVVIGSYALLSHFFSAEVDTLFVTAILTTMSFSVHDTIIIFDKIREYLRTEGRGNMEHYANRALTETLVRSFNNSMTIIFMLLALVLLGGSTIRFFAATLLIGTITGSYSSPFVATPIVVWLEKRNK
jgi:preprotein translocase subunit SecF